MKLKKIFYFYAFLFLSVVLTLSSCAVFRGAEVYDMSYDKTYMTALSALDDMEEWHLLETDELGGWIKVERGGYLYPDQEVTVIVKRLAPFQTKVQVIDKDNTLFSGKFFKAIDKRTENRALTYPS